MLTIACILATVDAMLVWRFLQPIYAPITFIGTDSINAIVPISERGATLKGGVWHPPISEAQILVRDMMGNERPLTLVTLTASEPYSNLIEVIKNLRANGKCNVLIRGSDEEGVPPYPILSDGSLFMKGVVLCGSSIGDAGFQGTLPADGMVQVNGF